VILLVSGASAVVDAIDHPNLGRLYVPGAGNEVRADKPFALDNGAFAGFDRPLFERLLDRAQRHAGEALWVAAPDVVGDAAATLRLFRTWAPRIRERGFPVALVLQDGLDIYSTPWRSLDAVFVGGTTGYKLSSEAAAIVREARERGLPAHMGRVNTLRRMKYAYSIGCTSVDGSSFSVYSKRWIPWALDFLERPPQLGLEVR
jgi:hypothetical protein